MIPNREAYDEEQHMSIKVKNKFINLLFENRQIQEVTYHKTIICFFVIFFIFLGLSIFFFIEVSNTVEVRKQYYSPNGICSKGSKCTVTFQITKYMAKPIYFMYELGNFYQNHRRYIQSKSNYQLAGNTIDSIQAQICFPYITNANMNNNVSWGGTILDPSEIASPCGSIAYTFFNDTYQLWTHNNLQIPINQTQISWSGDQGVKFKQSFNSSSVQWINPENQHFIVWMRTSGLPNFKKPWGRIQQDLPVGNYSVIINNNYNSTEWQGNRSFILTTLSIVGGKNYFLPVTFLTISILSLVATIFFCRRFRSLSNIAKIKR